MEFEIILWTLSFGTTYTTLFIGVWDVELSHIYWSQIGWWLDGEIRSEDGFKHE